ASVPASGVGGDPGGGSAPVRVLIVGGGSSHDFDRWFHREDTKTLSEGGKATVRSTDKPEDIIPALIDLDVLYLSHNHQMRTSEVLATGKNIQSGKTYPSVWVVNHAKARIVCIALGHDGAAHEHPAYQRILQNAVKWAARK